MGNSFFDKIKNRNVTKKKTRKNRKLTAKNVPSRNHTDPSVGDSIEKIMNLVKSSKCLEHDGASKKRGIAMLNLMN